MANYSYRQLIKHNHAWIYCLRIVEPVSSAGSHWTEIHFTEPQAAQVQANLRPHVTFESASGRSHWYLHNSGGRWTVGNPSGRTQDGEAEIAQKVVDDAVANNWIHAAPATTLVDADGFTTAESRRGRRGRMQTGWQH